MHSVDKQIDCREAAGQEGTPPPVVVLETNERDDGLGSTSEISREQTLNIYCFNRDFNSPHSLTQYHLN